MHILEGNGGEPPREKMPPQQAFIGCFVLCAGASLLISSIALLLWVLQ